MPDLLTHVLVAYALATALSWRYDWLTPAFVTAAMAGAMVPDMTKVAIVAHSFDVAAALGVPFDWFALHTLGGTAVSVLIGVVLVRSRFRRRAALALALGAATHLALDALLVKVTGHSYAVFWPLTAWHPPTPELLLSTDRWPAVLAAAVALAAYSVDRRAKSRTPGGTRRDNQE